METWQVLPESSVSSRAHELARQGQGAESLVQGENLCFFLDNRNLIRLTRLYDSML